MNHHIPLGPNEQRLYELIHDMLNLMTDDADTADRLLSILMGRFILPSAILEASGDELAEACADFDLDITFFSLIPGLLCMLRQESYGRHPILKHADAAIDYLMPLYIGMHVERFYAIYLDDGGRVIGRHCLQEGTHDEAPFYLNLVIRDILDLDASALILCHNHPGGSLTPSSEDTNCTLNAISALAPIGVAVLDHILVSGDQAISIRRSAKISAHLWISQAPDSMLTRHWLND